MAECLQWRSGCTQREALAPMATWALDQTLDDLIDAAFALRGAARTPEPNTPSRNRWRKSTRFARAEIPNCTIPLLSRVLSRPSFRRRADRARAKASCGHSSSVAPERGIENAHQFLQNVHHGRGRRRGLGRRSRSSGPPAAQRGRHGGGIQLPGLGQPRAQPVAPQRPLAPILRVQSEFVIAELIDRCYEASASVPRPRCKRTWMEHASTESIHTGWHLR